jgi:phage tail sheath protein FI
VTAGVDGTVPDPADAAGNGWRDAFDSLRPVDTFNLLVVPATFDFDVTIAAKAALLGILVDLAAALCRDKRAFYLADLPAAKKLDPSDATVVSSFQAAMSKMREQGAVYYPAFAGVNSGPTAGAIAGVYARTDANRGVWKAPAGTDAVIRGISGLSVNLGDKQNGVLNIRGINVLRSFPAYGYVIWGARTADGDNDTASDWKYIPVRRTTLFIEESLYRGTQWVVFEPNDEPLWAQIRLNVGAFMQGLFRQGAFQGKSAQEAYFVKCDKETTTQADINLGIVNIIVGFAPLKPAEFVVISLQQMAGQIGA